MYKQTQRLRIRSVRIEDIKPLWNMKYTEEHPEWKRWDAPYFPLQHLTLQEYTKSVLKHIQSKDLPMRCVIEREDYAILGEVSAYWIHEPSLWMELGILLYSSNTWGHGYGTEALQAWLDWNFEVRPVVRLGLTTWSGNVRMIRAAKQVGMRMEGCIRNARHVRGEWMDSIKMGILREEWEALGEQVETWKSLEVPGET